MIKITGGGESTSISVIVPSHNEPTTAQVVERICALDLPLREVIVVDDGSPDPVGEFPGQALVRVLRHPARQGKGAAIRSGVAAASGSIVVIQDADLEYAPEELPRLIAPIQAGFADAVLGSRYLVVPASGWRGYRLNRVANTLLTQMINSIWSVHLTDITTGHKAFRGQVLSETKTRDNGFAWDAAVVAQLSRRRYRFVEVPVGYSPRSYREGKKVSWVDFFRSAYAIVRDSVG